MYVRPTIGDKVTTLGVSGRLWRDALIMYDRASRSLWSQISGEAVAGPETGRKLEEIPSQLTTWGDWKRRHPKTLVLKKPSLNGSTYESYHRNQKEIGVVGSHNPDSRLGPKRLVFGVDDGERLFALPMELLVANPVINLQAAGTPMVLFTPSGELSTLAFERIVEGRTLDFEVVANAGTFLVRDQQTGSSWSWETGECQAGELAGSRLRSIDGVVVYWGVWARYHPDTELVGV